MVQYYGIDNSDEKWSKELRHTLFNLDSTDDEVVKAKFGPPKGFPRALEKMEQGKTLRDLNRVTFEFEDPLLMALCFEILNKKYLTGGRNQVPPRLGRRCSPAGYTSP